LGIQLVVCVVIFDGSAVYCDNACLRNAPLVETQAVETINNNYT
jgi:hypothetical protein